MLQHFLVLYSIAFLNFLVQYWKLTGLF